PHYCSVSARAVTDVSVCNDRLPRRGDTLYDEISCLRVEVRMFDRLICWFGAWRWAAMLLALSLVSGCASSLSAQVTRYQQWPADAAGAHYRIVASETQKGSLQFSAFADMVRAAI